MPVLFTQGEIVTRTIAEFQAYTAIRHSVRDPLMFVQLVVSDSGALDLSRQLGLVDGNVMMTAGSNQLILGGGNDRAVMGDGNDTVFGGNGQDDLSVGIGDDLVYGGADGDYILIGPRGGQQPRIDSSVFYGRDTLYGGDGDDLFGVLAS